MNKYRLNQILNVLLLPFNEIDIYQKDYIAELAIRFYQVKHSDIENYAGRKAGIADYDKAKRSLADFVCNNKRLNPRSLDELFLYLELFYPVEDMNKELEKYYLTGGQQEFAQDAMCRCYLYNIFRISNSLLTLRDGNISIRIWKNGIDKKYGEDIFGANQMFDKVEIWSMLSRNILPDVVIAAFYVDSELGVNDLYRQTGMVSLADNLLAGLLKKGIAETHLHLHAGHNYNIIWNKAVDPYFWQEPQKINTLYKWPGLLFTAAVFRLAAADFLEHRESSKYRSFLDYICTHYQSARESLRIWMEQMHNGIIQDGNESFCKLMRDMLEDLQIGTEIRAAEQDLRDDFLIDTIYNKYSCFQTYSELILLIRSMQYTRESPDDYYFLKLFIQYIRIKNDYLSIIVEAGAIQGYTFFQRYFSNAVGSMTLNKNSQYSKLIRSIFISQLSVDNIKKLEFRISPYLDMDQFQDLDENILHREIKKKLLAQIKGVLKVYRDYIGDLLEVESSTQGRVYETRDIHSERENIPNMAQAKNKINIPTIGIIYHFIKAYSMDNITGESCWISFISGKGFMTNHKLIWRRQLQHIAECIADIRSEVPFLHEYLIGIDAASNENDAEPWLFAPVYKAVRSRSNTKPLIYTEPYGYPQRIQNLGFTYHVGEDFRHILSGFRHIDEVLEHFHFIPGDRLGHAIALGNDLKNWINQNEIIAMPILEHFENLLWLWGNIVFKRMKLPISADELGGSIMKLAERLYVNITGINTFLLYEVYQDKFLRNHDEIFQKYYHRTNICWDRMGQLDDNYFCKYYTGDNAKLVVWDKEKLLCTHFCPVYEERYNQVILVDNNKIFYELYSAVQKELISKIERCGVFIETNPTSNTVIGEIEGIFKHYIIDLNSPEKDGKEGNNKVLVTINSDDPAVFNTNVENEFAYIYHALIHRGYKKEDALSWIDKVRQYGMDSSFIKKIKTPAQMIEEIDYMTKYIDDEYLKN